MSTLAGVNLFYSDIKPLPNGNIFAAVHAGKIPPAIYGITGGIFAY